MNVYVLTMYDPMAAYGYTEVFGNLKAAMRHAGVKNWRKHGRVYTWHQDTHEVSVKEKWGLISWKEDTAVYKIRKLKVRGRIE